MSGGLISNEAWLAGYASFERGDDCPWGDEAARLGWLQARTDLVAVCDLCGQADDHQHTIEEYGFPTVEQLQDEEAQVRGEVN